MGEEIQAGAIEVVFLACIALCLWKQLWIALGILVVVIAASNALFFFADARVAAVIIAFTGVFLLFPAVVYKNLEGREREDRRKSIRRSRRHTGREG